MRVLIFVNYYTPAYKAGGPLKSLQGLVDNLGEEIDFSIVTSDRDFGDNQPFPDIETGRWTEQGNCRVLYANHVNKKALSHILKDESWDLLYLQSFFDLKFTLKPLLWWKMGVLKVKKVLVAPRGEFSPGAIQLKATKKRTFLKLAKWLKLYKGVFWHASSDRERAHILSEIPHLASPDHIFIASDIPPKPLPVDPQYGISNARNNRRLRVLHLSRVTKMKNLEFALHTLSELTFPIELNIYGPIDDPDYWQNCTQVIESLPSNIEVNFHGSVPPPQVPEKFASHDVFFLPTRGENFGHVVFESLQNGCPVLLSDQTPWQDLGEKQVGWVLPLDNMEPFRQALTKLNAESETERQIRKETCLLYAKQFVADGEIVTDNRQMFAVLK